MTPMGAKAVLDQIRKILPGLVRREISSRRIMRTLRGAGLHLRTTDFMEEIRQARGVWKGEQWARAAPSTEVYKKGWMVEEDLRYPAKYRVYFDMNIYDTETGITSTRKVSMYTDDLLAPDEWAEHFKEPYEAGMYEITEAIADLHVINVRHNLNQPY